MGRCQYAGSDFSQPGKQCVKIYCCRRICFYRGVCTNIATVLSVSDTGVGMTEENRNQFNSTVLSSTKSTPGTEREKGTGLGLLLCKTFTRLMNGQITVEKNKERGCRFELILSGYKEN
jgi:signal transduction histidine kinase